ncbi:hypothetical protein GVAV_000381 [Gurleya vavrai]
MLFIQRPLPALPKNRNINSRESRYFSSDKITYENYLIPIRSIKMDNSAYLLKTFSNDNTGKKIFLKNTNPQFKQNKDEKIIKSTGFTEFFFPHIFDFNNQPLEIDNIVKKGQKNILTNPVTIDQNKQEFKIEKEISRFLKTQLIIVKTKQDKNLFFQRLVSKNFGTDLSFSLTEQDRTNIKIAKKIKDLLTKYFRTTILASSQNYHKPKENDYNIYQEPYLATSNDSLSNTYDAYLKNLDRNLISVYLIFFVNKYMDVHEKINSWRLLYKKFKPNKQFFIIDIFRYTYLKKDFFDENWNLILFNKKLNIYINKIRKKHINFDTMANEKILSLEYVIEYNLLWEFWAGLYFKKKCCDSDLISIKDF